MPSHGPMYPNGPMPPQETLPAMLPNGTFHPSPVPNGGAFHPPAVPNNGSFDPASMPNGYFGGPMHPDTNYSPSVSPQGNFNLKQENVPSNRDSVNDQTDSSEAS